MIPISQHQFKRHDLVVLKLDSVPISEHSERDLSFFQNWIRQQFPFIVTRQFAGSSKSIKLGLPYYDAKQHIKLRYSLEVDVADITKVNKLPKLTDVIPRLDLSSDVDIRVYGSYAWQYLTGIQYVQDSSDLDILFDYQNQTYAEISEQINLISKIDNIKKLDGEIRLAKFGDCQIQELLKQDTVQLLFKTFNDVMLIERDAIYAEYPKLAVK